MQSILTFSNGNYTKSHNYACLAFTFSTIYFRNKHVFIFWAQFSNIYRDHCCMQNSQFKWKFWKWLKVSLCSGNGNVALLFLSWCNLLIIFAFHLSQTNSIPKWIKAIKSEIKSILLIKSRKKNVYSYHLN